MNVWPRANPWVGVSTITNEQGLHADDLAVHLDRNGGFRNRKLRTPQPKCMTTFRVQMHFHRNASLFQRGQVGQRVLYRIDRVISVSYTHLWTVRTADRMPPAHYEHTIVITKGMPILLTA